MVKKRLAVFSFLVLSLVLAFPALGNPTPCPPSYESQPAFFVSPDRNGNNTVCSKSVRGSGNTGEGKNYKDENQPR